MGETISVQVQLFARLRELCGDRSRIETRVPAGSSAQQCFELLCERFESLTPFRGTLAVAVNDEYAGWERELREGDVVAFIPPVSGGSGAAAPATPASPRPLRRPTPRGARP